MRLGYDDKYCSRAIVSSSGNKKNKHIIKKGADQRIKFTGTYTKIVRNSGDLQQTLPYLISNQLFVSLERGDGPHLLCSICVHSFEALAKAVWLFIIASHQSKLICSQMFPVDISVDLLKSKRGDFSIYSLGRCWGCGWGHLIVCPWVLQLISTKGLSSSLSGQNTTTISKILLHRMAKMCSNYGYVPSMHDKIFKTQTLWLFQLHLGAFHAARSYGRIMWAKAMPIKILPGLPNASYIGIQTASWSSSIITTVSMLNLSHKNSSSILES